VLIARRTGVAAFGVMFFGDPVAAFAHMRSAASPGVLLCMASTRGLRRSDRVSADGRASFRLHRGGAPP